MGKTRNRLILGLAIAAGVMVSSLYLVYRIGYHHGSQDMESRYLAEAAMTPRDITSLVLKNRIDVRPSRNRNLVEMSISKQIDVETGRSGLDGQIEHV